MKWSRREKPGEENIREDIKQMLALLLVVWAVFIWIAKLFGDIGGS